MDDARTRTTDLLIAGRGAGAFETLVPLVYDELKRLAGALLRHERPDHTLQPTALAHEAYLELVDATRIEWRDRTQFLGIAARAMRQILVHHARAHGARKRGGGARRVTLVDLPGDAGPPRLEILALEEALVELAALDPRKARVVELRFFGGLTAPETAELLGVSLSTTEDDWAFARAWLARRLMSSASFTRLAELFAAALRLPVGDREPYLASACGDDDDLRSEATALLEEHERGPSPLDEAAGLRTTAESALFESILEAEAREPLPERIGPYRVVRRIGAGGMGAVFEALDDALGRRMAVKVLRHDVTSLETRRRFDVEARALARLAHPGIARILASGSAATAEGSRPWIAMELIEGRPLLDSARERALSVRDRVRLLADVADAVAHAHVHGVVHRDLKPANVLVEPSGQPKVLDFGIARIVDEGTGPASAHTVAGRILGTVAYMSPEQALCDPDEVDARSDVYSLGVIAYELLAGRLPVDVTGRSLAAAVHAIVEVEAPTLGRANNALRGDLSAIVAKALAKAKERRYQGAGALADDLRRWLADEDVVARLPTALERLGRFVRRHRVLVAAASAVTAALVTGVVLALASARTAERAREDAERSAYRAEIAAAAAALRAGDPTDARRHLELAPVDRRGWEWRYLASRLDASVVRVPIDLPAERALAISTDLDSAAVVDADGTLRIVDARTGRTRVRTGHVVPSDGHACWSGDVLVTGGEGGRVRFIGSRDGAERRPPLEVGGPIGAMDVTPDGQRIAVALYGSNDPATRHRLAVYDVATGAVVTERTGAHRSGAAIAFSPDGTTLALGAWDHRVRMLRVSDPDSITVLEGHANSVVALAFAGPDRLVTGSHDRKLGIWRTDGAASPLLLGGHGASIDCVARSPAAPLAASGSRDGTVRLWDLERGLLRAVLETGRPGAGCRVRFSSDGEWLMALTPSEIHVWAREGRAPSDVLVGHLGVAAGNQFPYVYDVDWSPNGAKLLSAGWDGTLRAWDTATSALRATFHCEALVHAGAWAPDGASVAAACGDGTVRVFPVEGGPARVVRSGFPSVASGAFAYAPDGRSLLTSADGDRIDVLDPATLATMGTWDGHARRVRCVAFSRDGTRCATGDDAGVCLLRDARTGRVLARADGSGQAVHGLAFSPDGTRVALAGRDRTVALLDARTGARLRTIRGHTDAVYAVVWTLDGERVVSGGGDGIVRVFDASSGDELLALSGHEAYVMALALAPDGQTLASASGDNTVRLWSCRPLAERWRRAGLGAR